MANYTAADIKALRERTGAGMLDVKKALDEAGGDAEKAVEILRVKGLKGVSKREGRAASDGLARGPVPLRRSPFSFSAFSFSAFSWSLAEMRMLIGVDLPSFMAPRIMPPAS